MIGKHKIIMTQTPFRLNFFGGGTDLPDYFNQYDGACLGTTINKYSYVTLNSLDRLTEKKIRLSYSKLECVETPDEIQHDIVRAALKFYSDKINGSFLDIHSFADLPSGTGIGSSSSFTVGFLNALHLLSNTFQNPKSLAKEAIYIEREILQEKGGWQDQIHAAFGGFNRIDFQQNNFSVNPIYTQPENLTELENSICFYFTGQTRSSSKIHQEVQQCNEEQKQNEKLNFLKRMKEQVSVGQEILLGTRSSTQLIKDFGKLLDEAWQLKRELSNCISNSILDEIYEVAMKNGALGGKLLGAGGGGFFVFICPQEQQENLNSALHRLNKVDIKFERQGSRFIFSNQ